MREIKFRGKRMDNSQWVYGYYVQMHGEHKSISYIYTGEVDTGTRGFIHRQRVISESVGEWTGLMDKSGREIYEGDVLSFVPVDSPKFNAPYKPFVVHWKDADARWSDWSPRGDVEIIGNIYENPDLAR